MLLFRSLSVLLVSLRKEIILFIVYKVVEQYSPISSTYDELGLKGWFFKFRACIQNIGNYPDDKNIKKDRKPDLTNPLEFMKVKPEDIEGSLSFKLE